jgi:TonB family protein
MLLRLMVTAALAVVPLAAQRSPGATLSGTVLDPSGAAVPRAQVIAANSDTHTRELATADEAGAFVLAGIPAGRYQIEVRARGFAPGKKEVSLEANNAEKVTLTLNIGQISERVEVVGQGRPRASVPPVNGTAPGRVRVGGNVQATKLVKMVRPAYPESARARGVEGTVLLQAVISVEGMLLNANVLNTAVDGELAQSALDAVRQWRYSPTLLNGQPVEVVTTVTVVFRLAE